MYRSMRLFFVGGILDGNHYKELVYVGGDHLFEVPSLLSGALSNEAAASLLYRGDDALIFLKSFEKHLVSDGENALFFPFQF